MSIEGSPLSVFLDFYVNKLREPSCLPEPLMDICGGCKINSTKLKIGTQETFRQLCLKCTKNGKVPLKLWFDSYEEMEVLSRKSNSLRTLFSIFDAEKIRIFMDKRKVDRIDTLELFAVIIMALPSDLELKLSRTVFVQLLNRYCGRIWVQDGHRVFQRRVLPLLRLIVSWISKSVDRQRRKEACAKSETNFKQRPGWHSGLDIQIGRRIYKSRGVLRVNLCKKKIKFRRCTESEPLVSLFQAFFPQMEQSLTYGREKAIEVLGMKQDCRKLVHELIKGAVEKANMKQLNVQSMRYLTQSTLKWIIISYTIIRIYCSYKLKIKVNLNLMLIGKATRKTSTGLSSPRMQKAQEISIALDKKKQLTKNRTPSHSNAHMLPIAPYKLQPSASTKHISHPGSTRATLCESFIGGPRKSGKENTKTPFPLKLNSNSLLDQSTGICIKSDVTPGRSVRQKPEKRANPADPFQALITRAQQELEKCASWTKKDQVEPVVNEQNEEMSFEDSESMACTVREARKGDEDKNCIEEHSMRKELEKWKEFGYLLAESYDQLKKNFNKEIAESSKNKQIIKALKEQVTKLKDLLKHTQGENESLRNELSNEESIREHFITIKGRLEAAIEENRALRKENEKLIRQINAGEREKEIWQNEKLLNEKLVQQLNDKIKAFCADLIINRNSKQSLQRPAV
eukprot:TRINITY_DN120372_c1_g1_i1.p1 TRINITY_DN120372_c1_g1~~TRINITY_DN120372_c1_g1_i1.p1  ORF type:complete len:684 (-),score=40.78 TRINITY_DN120372_c1_g1_i1:1858-3909(-)